MRLETLLARLDAPPSLTNLLNTSPPNFANQLNDDYHLIRNTSPLNTSFPISFANPSKSPQFYPEEQSPSVQHSQQFPKDMQDAHEPITLPATPTNPPINTIPSSPAPSSPIPQSGFSTSTPISSPDIMPRQNRSSSLLDSFHSGTIVSVVQGVIFLMPSVLTHFSWTHYECCHLLRFLCAFSHPQINCTRHCHPGSRI